MNNRNPSFKLIIENLSKQFKFQQGGKLSIIDNVSFKVQEGSFVTILGPSGCGKTTLLKVIAGLIGPTCGTIILDGQKITGPSSKCGFIFQKYTLFPWLTVEKNVRFGLNLQNLSNKEKDRIIDHFLNMVGLLDFRNFYPESLSGGMRQRVALARTLAVNPEILLMDEPFGALDTQTRAIMQEKLLEIWDKARKTIVFVTHDIEEAIFLSDTIYISTARPLKIIKRIQVTFPRPRPFHIKTQSHFTDVKREIINVLRDETMKGINARER